MAAHSPVDDAASGAAASASGTLFQVTYDNKSFATSLPPSSIATYTWTPGSNTVSETETETSAGSLVKNVELAPQPNLSFGATSKSLPAVAVKSSVSMQPIAGFGGAMTQSAAELINNSPSDKQIMDALFEPSGADFSIVRVPMGASDFVTGPIYQGGTSYSYDDNHGKADPNLAKFSVGVQTTAGQNAVPCVPAASPGDYGTGDYADTIPALQCAKSLNPSLNLLAVPWSAPGWMKIKDPTIPTACTGSDDFLKPSYYDLYAAYFVKFLEAYQTANLPVSEVSMQNEPENCSTSYPTMEMTPVSQATFAVDLHDNLTDSTVKAKLPVTPAIMAYDHNYLNSWNGHASGVTDYPEQVIKQASGTVGMVGFHHYNGTLAQEEQALDKEHAAYPKVPIWMTEATGTYGTSTAAQNLVWEGQHDLMEPLQNWARASLYLNLVLDAAGGPHHGGCGYHQSTACRGMITLHSDGTYTLNEDYYDWAQFSKFIQPGATHICSSIIDLSTNTVHKCTGASSSWIPTNSGNLIDTVAFRNRNGSFVLVAMNTTPTPTPSSSTWTAAEAPLPANADPAQPDAELRAIACPSATECVAAGRYNAGLMMVTGAGSNWHATGLTLPSDADMAATPGVEQVACASATSCTAAGYYGDMSYTYHSILVTGSGSSWTLRQAPLPANAASEDQSELNSVACTADGTCVAVGWYIDKSGDEQGLIETGSGSSWQASEAVLPANVGSEPANAIIAFLDSVSCPASNECVVVGQYDPDNGYGQGLVMTETASGWTPAEAPQPTPTSGTGASLETVACWAVGHCLASGFYQEADYSNTGSLISITASSLTAVEAPLPANATDNNPDLTETGELCSSSATCVTYGQYTDASNYLEGTVLTGPGTAATAAEIPPAGSTSPLTDAYPYSAACGSLQSCVVVGSAQLPDGSTPAFLDVGLGSSWQIAQAPLPANAAQDTGSGLYSVACPTTGQCIAVGSYLNDSSGGVEGLIDIGPTGTP